MATNAVAVMAFNWFFVPPRFTFTVDLHQNALLLVALLLVNWIIAGLVVRQRQLAKTAYTEATREARLRQWGDTLRDASDPAAHAAALRTALQEASQSEVVVSVLRTLGGQVDAADVLQVGEPNDAQRAGLALCAREGRAMGRAVGATTSWLTLTCPFAAGASLWGLHSSPIPPRPRRACATPAPSGTV